MTEPPEGTPPVTPLAAQPLDSPPPRTAEYAAALAALPPEALPEVLARLDAAVGAAAAGDTAPLRHVLDSLLMTARLGQNAAYLRAVADADAAEAAGGETPEDVAAFVARMRSAHDR